MSPFPFLNNIVELAEDLIRFKSTAERLDEREAIIEYCRQFLEPTGTKIQIHHFNESPLLLASLKGTGPRICLYAHLDVVDANLKSFDPEVRHGRLYGRGSGDMKGAAATLILLFAWYARQKHPPALDLLLSTDEENGGLDGVGALLKKKYHCDVVVMPDSDHGIDKLILEQKGLLELRLWQNGKSAHGATPHLGQNAIELLWQDYQKIKALFKKEEDKKWGKTINLGRIQGGKDINQVPDFAELCLDMRFTKDKERERVLNTISRLTKKVEIQLNSPPFVQDPKNKYVHAFEAAVEEWIDEKPERIGEESASDARFFSHRGIPTLVTGVKKGNMHSEGEWCSVHELQLLYQITESFIERCRAL